MTNETNNRADSLASAGGVEVVAWWNTKWSLGATIRELSEHKPEIGPMEETPAYKAGELEALVRQSDHLAALSKEREVADGLAALLEEARDDVSECLNGVLAGTGLDRYERRIASYQDQLARIDAALTAHRESRGAASEAKEG